MENKKQLIISVGREYGSGGHEIGRKIADKLGIQFLDRSIIEELAVLMGADPEELSKYDEQPKRYFINRTVRGYSNSNAQAVAELQFNLMHEKESHGKSFVVVGRCADAIFKNNAGLISFFITADEDDKIKRVMEKRNLSEKEAKTAIVRHDKTRKAYHNSMTTTQWGEAKSYDLVINSSKLGIDGTVDFLLNYIERLSK